MVGIMINSPQGVEYDKMVELSLNVLMDYQEFNFPLHINDLAEKIGIELKSYSKLSFDLYALLYSKSPLGITVMSKYSDGHIDYEAYYNGVDNRRERNRFTIAHEIGHIVNGDINKPITPKDEMLYDYFAKCLLAPQCLIIDNKEFDVNTIVTNYQVSKQVAEFWLQTIKKRISLYGEDCLTKLEKTYLKTRKKYYNYQPPSK